MVNCGLLTVAFSSPKIFTIFNFIFDRGIFIRLECAWNDHDRTLSFMTKSTPKKTATNRSLAIEVAGTAGAKTVTLDDHPLVVKF